MNSKALEFILLLQLVLIVQLCLSQSNTVDTTNSIYGRWRCVKLDTKRYQKFTSEQGHQLSRSILTIEPNEYFYSGVDFLEACNFSHWKMSMYDTSQNTGGVLEYIYKKSIRENIRFCQPVDDRETLACYNDCALFYLNKDTLINLCGGYLLYLIKDRRVEGSSRVVNGDTVRCLYHEDKTCTGYVIQGSRKAGKVIHVIPANKDVPLEIEERDSVTDLPKKK